MQNESAITLHTMASFACSEPPVTYSHSMFKLNLRTKGKTRD